MENYVGKRLDGRYEIHEIIGVGGMSVVYKAYDNVDDRIVAVKILKEEFTHDDDFVRRFKNESKAIAVLSHPNIVKVYDVSFGDKLQYIVMEYVDGITLKEYIQKQGIITWNDAVFFISQILKALQHAHDKGIVHRDIKPQNIILLPTGNIKVTDFGIARFSRTETKTLTENAIGSVHYISPEQAKGEFTDERADIYSLGIVFYEMLAGRVPFESDSAVSVALMQVNDEPARLTDINPEVPLGLEQICAHAMQKNPLERYQTATEMLLDLEEVIRNPNATFDYTYYIDNQPTRYVKRNDSAYKGNSSDDADDYAKEKAERRKNRRKVFAATVMGLFLLGAAVIGLIYWLTDGITVQTLKLEDFVGQSYDAVIDYYTDYTFDAEFVETSDYPEGTIIDQSPAQGSVVAKGNKITLKVAASADTVTVPMCYDLTKEKAVKTLELEGLTNVKIAQVSSETVKEGYVVYTEPRYTSSVSKDTLITVFVSTGPSTTVVNTYTVPDVVGLLDSDARAFLLKTGFRDIVIVPQDSMVPKGTVLSQNPKYGSTQREDATIKIFVSTGYTTTTAPPEYTITITVKLPTCVDEDGNYIYDYLIASVNGVQDSRKQVKLDGSDTDIKIVQQGKQEITVVVGLDEIPEQQNLKYTLNEDKQSVVDFRRSSFNHETTTEAPTQAEEDTSSEPVENPLDPTVGDNSDNNTNEP